MGIEKGSLRSSEQWLVLASAACNLLSCNTVGCWAQIVGHIPLRYTRQRVGWAFLSSLGITAWVLRLDIRKQIVQLAPLLTLSLTMPWRMLFWPYSAGNICVKQIYH